jgi:predicted lipid-binding transport protein (Tim44 family)
LKRRLGVALALLTFAATAWPALARVGGGGGYSGGGSSGGGDGGDAGLIFGLVRLLIWLVFRHPVIGIPLVILILIVLAKMAKTGQFTGRVREHVTVYPRPGPASRSAVNFTPVRSTDPFFSEPLFLDFAQLVFARAHACRGANAKEPLGTWMAPPAIDKLFADRVQLESVSDVVFGATRIESIGTDAGFVVIDVAFEANLTEVRAGSAAQILANEKWTFRRKAGVRSPGPERMRALGCSGCGSTLEPKTDGTCPSCGAPRRGGLTQWEVTALPYADRRPLSAPELDVDEGGGVERGTDLPTIFDPRLGAAKRAFEGKHPDQPWAVFDARVREAFVALQSAWSKKTWEAARPYETDALYQTHRFWMERYAAFGLTNRVEQVAIAQVILVKLDADAFYEAATVRIVAQALDWTEDNTGNVVGGNKTRPRRFSEYWTFLRAIPGTAAAPASCPSCAAPLPPGGGATVCAYCGSKLEGGAFDWVASRIEQDDAYAG